MNPLLLSLSNVHCAWCSPFPCSLNMGNIDIKTETVKVLVINLSKITYLCCIVFFKNSIHSKSWVLDPWGNIYRILDVFAWQNSWINIIRLIPPSHIWFDSYLTELPLTIFFRILSTYISKRISTSVYIYILYMFYILSISNIYLFPL